VIVATASGYVLALSNAGPIEWYVAAAGAVTAPVAVLPGDSVAFADSAWVYVANADGEVVGTYAPDGAVSSLVSDAVGGLYFVTPTTLAALTDGAEESWTAELGTAPTGPLSLGQSGRLLVPTGDTLTAYE